MKFRLVSLIAFIGLGGCQPPLNPPRLVLDSPTDAPVQLFVQASILMARAYRLDPVSYSEIQIRTERAGFSALPLLAPDSVRASPALSVRLRNKDTESDAAAELINKSGIKPFVKYYIRTGLRASQVICRNYLTRLDEGNQYLDFLKREIGVASTFASGIFALVNVNSTLSKAALVAITGTNEGLNAYQDYRFLTIDREAARVLVETAQNQLADYYLQQVDIAQSKGEGTADDTLGWYTFSDALNAVSTIEYQCTREGIRYLLNRSINNSPTNMVVDKNTGTIAFKSAQTVDELPSNALIKGAKRKVQ